jgi:hypothetical protein
MVEVLMWRDDLTGELGAEPYHFAVRGCVVDIDLTPENQAALLNVLAPFIQAGRINGKPGAVPSEVRAILNGNKPAIEPPPDEQTATTLTVDYEVVEEPPAEPPPAQALPPAAKRKPKRRNGRGYENDQHTAKQRREIAEWIKVHRIPNTPARGRKPADVWAAFLAKDLTLLEDRHQPPALRAAISRAS